MTGTSQCRRPLVPIQRFAHSKHRCILSNPASRSRLLIKQLDDALSDIQHFTRRAVENGGL